MHDAIREHIRDGKLALALSEINGLDLTRTQRDELFVLEGRFENYQRNQSIESPDFQQRTLNKLMRDTLDLLGRIEDEQGETNEANPPSPSIERGAKPANESKKSFPSIIIGALGLLVFVIGAYAFWPKGGGEVANEAKVEKVEQPAEKPPQKPSSGQASSNDFKSVDPKPSITLPTNTTITQLKEPQERLINSNEVLLNREALSKLRLSAFAPLIVYGPLGEIVAPEGKYSAKMTEKMAPKLDEKISYLRIIPYESDWRFFQSGLMNTIRSGRYTGGTLNDFSGSAYLIVVELKKANNSTLRECNLKMLTTSDGKYLLNERRSFRDGEESFSSIVSHIAQKIDAVLE